MILGNEKFTYEEVELIATYEELYKIPEEEKITDWWGDMHMHEFKHMAQPEKAREMLEKSLKAVNMTRKELADFHYVYRSRLIEKMKDNMSQKYEAVIIFNKPMLFTNLRIEDGDVPDGMYRYDIRDGGMDGNMCELKDYVAVNHWGTVLSKEAIEPRVIDGEEMTSANGILMTDDDYNYTGEEFTTEQFLENYDYLVSEYCEPEQTNEMTMG